MRITQEQMESRKRILKIRSAITNAMADSGVDATPAELLVALSEQIAFWSGALLKDEHGEE